MVPLPPCGRVFCESIMQRTAKEMDRLTQIVLVENVGFVRGEPTTLYTGRYGDTIRIVARSVSCETDIEYNELTKAYRLWRDGTELTNAN